MTEREKQIAGLEYDSSDEEVKSLQLRGQSLAMQLNNTSVLDTNKRESIIGQLFNKCGKNVRIFSPFRVDFGCNITAGNDVLINQNCTFLDTNEIIIGDRVLIAPDVKIYTATHPLEASKRYYSSNQEYKISTSSKKVIIGNDVWIGGNSTILPGVKIGNGVIVGAGSVVTKNVEDNTIVAGNPAKIIKYIGEEKKC